MALKITIEGDDSSFIALLKEIAQGVVVGSGHAEQIEAKLNQIIEGQTKIMATEQQVIDALNKIDAATTAIAGNVSTVATGLATVGGEVDALVQALKNAGVSDTLVAQASALSDRLGAASDALAAQVPVLQQIAASGVLNPVPAPPPPPPPPTV